MKQDLIARAEIMHIVYACLRQHSAATAWAICDAVNELIDMIIDAIWGRKEFEPVDFCPCLPLFTLCGIGAPWRIQLIGSISVSSAS